jgi:N-dimethylarginine dimethylaminohydrolase
MKNFGLKSEYKKLNSVLLYKPGKEIHNYPDPAEIQQLRPIDHDLISAEYKNIIATFEKHGVTVVQIDPTPINDDRWYQYNMMYCRDLLFMTPQGAILSNMANSTREHEVLYAERTLKNNNIPILHKIDDDGRFEGADALWVNEKLVVVGVGNRTNSSAFQQIRTQLSKMDVECVALPSYQTKTQHILGTVQFVDNNLVLVRYEITDLEVIRFLEYHNFTVIKVPDNIEVRTKQAMNIVTVSPRNIIMTADCPETKSIFQNAGLTIAAELDLTQMISGAGGLACATGILARED